jgi:D-serine dehydratase
MVKKVIEGKSIEELIEDYPLLNQIMKTEEILWINQNYTSKQGLPSLTEQDISEASERLKRFAPYSYKID